MCPGFSEPLSSSLSVVESFPPGSAQHPPAGRSREVGPFEAKGPFADAFGVPQGAGKGGGGGELLDRRRTAVPVPPSLHPSLHPWKSMDVDPAPSPAAR